MSGPKGAPPGGWYMNMGSAWKGARVPWQTEGFRRRQSRDQVGALPEPIYALAYEEYDRHFGNDQSYETMLQRGGLGVQEVIGLLADALIRERNKK